MGAAGSKIDRGFSGIVLSGDERKRLKDLKKENKGLRTANEILQKELSVFRPGEARPSKKQISRLKQGRTH